MISHKNILLRSSQIAETIRQSNKDACVLPMESSSGFKMEKYLKYLSLLSKSSKYRRATQPAVRIRKNLGILGGKLELCWRSSTIVRLNSRLVTYSRVNQLASFLQYPSGPSD